MHIACNFIGIYDTFIFHLNNLGNLNFIKYYVMLISMINTTSKSTLVYGKWTNQLIITNQTILMNKYKQN